MRSTHSQNAAEINLLLQENISMKKSWQRQPWGKNMDIIAMFGAKLKKKAPDSQ